jgi:predicted ATPase/class 3 adenylate cyclase/Tfp pilus assembly protein PilF
MEGSVRLWQAHPDLMPSLIARHEAIIAECVERHGGLVVKSMGEGDSVFAVFDRPSAALTAACEIQSALLAEQWPADVALRVRIGLHAGEAGLRDGDYFGPAVNLCARLRDAGHGGQILLSRAMRDLVSAGTPTGVCIVDVGRYRLKGYGEPVRVFQAGTNDLPSEFPALRAAMAEATNLPTELTSFVGREQEVAAIKRALAATRFVTLTGIGGAGKTRLAMRVARDLVEAYRDGAWWVELAERRGRISLLRAIGEALGMRDEPGHPVQDTVAEALRARQLLLVMDNCEHTVEACAMVVDGLLRACPEITILATSREALGVPGEQTWVVPPLSLPSADHIDLDRCSDSEAVQLFVQRATMCDPDFVLSADNAPAVAEICRRLEGIPLSVELAAAHVNVLSPAQIARQVEDCFDILRTRLRGVMPRHQSLRAAMAWSYDMLSDPEQTLFRRLAVFNSWFELEAAEAVGGGQAMDVSVIALLATLHQKSMVVVECASGTSFYRLLEPLRQYGLEQLAAANEVHVVRTLHAEFYTQLAEESEPALKGACEPALLDRLDRGLDNIRAALTWAAESDREDLGLRLGGAIWRFWYVRGYLTEGLHHLRRLLRSSAPTADLRARAKALHAAGTLANSTHRYDEARALLEESVSLRRRLADAADLAASVNNLGLVHYGCGNYRDARIMFEESLTTKLGLGDRRGTASSLTNLALVCMDLGDYAQARRFAEQSLDIKRESGDRSAMAVTLMTLGRISEDTGDYGRAMDLFDQSLAIHRQMEDQYSVAQLLRFRGHAAQAAGDLASAHRLCEESLDIELHLGRPLTLAQALRLLADVLTDEGAPHEAARALGEALQLLRPMHPGADLAGALAAMGRAKCSVGDYASAKSAFAESLAVLRGMDSRLRRVELLESIAVLVAAEDRDELALQLVGVADSERAQLGAPRPPNTEARLARGLPSSSDEGNTDDVGHSETAGRSMLLEEACAAASAALL